MVQKWVIVTALLAVLIVLLGGAAGYEVAKDWKHPSQGVAPPTPLDLGVPPPNGPIEPVTAPVQTSPLPEAMLQLMTLKEGQSASFAVGALSGQITKGCYDKWTVSMSGGASRAYETWGDLTTALYKLALNANQFTLVIHGKTFRVTNAHPRLVMRSAQGDSFDLDAMSNPPIYSGIGALEQTA